MKTNYILIDYENVQPTTVALCAQEHVRVIVFVGANQPKVAFEVATSLQAMGPRAWYVKTCGTGANALDFHIAFYIGQLAAHEPDASFHIISKDTGFDPLIQHLKAMRISACRSAEIGDIAPLKSVTHALKAAPAVKGNTLPAKAATPKPKALTPPVATAKVKAASATSLSAQVAVVLVSLQRQAKAKPGSVKALTNWMNVLFLKKLSEEALTALLKELQRQGIVAIEDTKVTYMLPGELEMPSSG